MAAVACCATLHGQIISVNFSENSGNQAFVGGQNIGPLGTDSAFWNNTNGQPNLAAGTLPGLIDSTGTATAAAMTWSSANAWYNGDGTADDAHRQSVGYLDDGGSGINVTISNIPYSNYRVYGLYSSDQGAGSAIAQDMNVNGTWVFGNAAPTSVPAYASINETLAATGNFWAPLTPNEQRQLLDLRRLWNQYRYHHAVTNERSRACRFVGSAHPRSRCGYIRSIPCVVD